MRRYLILLGILTLVLAQWGCDGDEGPSLDADPDGEEVVSAPSPAPPSPAPPSPAPPPPPPPPGGGTSGETNPGTKVQESGSPPGGQPELDEAEFEQVGVAEDAPKDELLENLSQIGEALIKYHKKYNNYPPRVHFGEGNKRLLSWRVLLLPFLGEGALFDQFKMDEPWDSANNRPLAAKMPNVYKTPDGHGQPKTCYVVPTGIGTIFSARKGTAKGAIRDGLKDTLIVVEADLNHAVVWTAPDDLQFDKESPSAGLGNFRDESFLAVSADGTAHYLPDNLNPELMQALFTINGGDKVSVKALEIKPDDEATGTSLLSQTTRAMLELHEPEGLRFLMAEAVVHDNQKVLGSLRWSPTLRRPFLVCRWGVVVKASKTKIIQEEDMTVLRRAVGDPIVDPIRKQIAEEHFGHWFAALADIDDAITSPNVDIVVEGKDGEVLRGPKGPRREPGIVIWGKIDPDTIKQTLAEEEIDVALIVSVVTTPFSDKRTQPALTFRLYDVQNDTVLYTTEPVRTTQVVMSIQHGEAAVNPLDELIEDMLYHIDVNLRLTSMPNLTPAQIQDRARSLISKRYTNPLPALTELRYYAWKNLITPEQLAACYKRIVGDANGAILANGSREERLKVVQQWLPAQAPAPAPAKKEASKKPAGP